MAWAKVTAGSDKAVGQITGPVQWAISAGPRWAVVELSPADFDKIDRGAEKRGVPSYYCRTALGIRFWPVAGHDGEFVGLLAGESELDPRMVALLERRIEAAQAEMRTWVSGYVAAMFEKGTRDGL